MTGNKEQELRRWKFQVIRSNRKTIALQIDKNLKLTVRAPFRMTDNQIKDFLHEKTPWISKHMQEVAEKMKNIEEHPVERMTTEEIRALADKAVEYIPERVAYFAEQMQVSYGRITIRNQKTRWGSCSTQSNLNFNCLLMLTPPEVIDYVVVHELCHRKEMNHSPRFWKEVEAVLPNYREQKEWLKEHGNEVMRKMLG